MIESERIWQWPNDIVMSPSSLNTFGQCPYRIKLYYLQDIKLDVWFHHLEMGNAAHEALKLIARRLKANAPDLTDDQIKRVIGTKLPIPYFPSEIARNADIELALQWVRRGQRYLERLEVEAWLTIESRQYREFTLFPSRSSYKFVAVPDLVLKRVDEDGRPYIQIIDWKTGRIREESDVPVLHRFVLRDRLREWINDTGDIRVVFTWYWLDENVRKDLEISVEHCNHAWPDILAQMEAMATETEWKATPGWYCHYCPYHGSYCNEQIPYDD